MYAQYDPFDEPEDLPESDSDSYQGGRRGRSGNRRRMLLIFLLSLILAILFALYMLVFRNGPIPPPLSQSVTITLAPLKPGAAYGSQVATISVYQGEKLTLTKHCTVLPGNQATERIVLRYQVLSGAAMIREIDGCHTLTQAVHHRSAAVVPAGSDPGAITDHLQSLLICLDPAHPGSITISSTQKGFKVQGANSCS